MPDGLVITQVNITLPAAGSPSDLLAYATLVFNGSLKVNSVRLVRLPSGSPCLVFPTAPLKVSDVGKTYTLCHPLNQRLRDYCTEVVVEAYLGMQAEAPRPRPRRVAIGGNR